MNKFEIGDYLRHIYGVEVTNVNTHIVAGKVKRHRYARQRTIKRPDYKLAYVTLVWLAARRIPHSRIPPAPEKANLDQSPHLLSTLSPLCRMGCV